MLGALLRRTRIEDPHVRRAVLRALGAIGGPAALRALARLRETVDPATRRRLLLARALIAHRHGLDGASLPPVEGEPRRPEQGGDRTTLTAALESGRGGLPASAVGDVVWTALSAERPRTFYPVMRRRLLNWTIPLALPARLLDRLIANRLGIGKR